MREGTSRDSDSGAGSLVREGEGSSENRGHSPYFECCEDTYRHARGTIRGSWRLVAARGGPHGLPIGILPAFKTGGVVSVSLQRPIFPFGWLPAPLSESREVPSWLVPDGP